MWDEGIGNGETTEESNDEPFFSLCAVTIPSAGCVTLRTNKSDEASQQAVKKKASFFYVCVFFVNYV